MNMSSPEIQLAGYGTAYVGTLTATTLLIKDSKITKEDARSVAVVLASIATPLSQLDANQGVYVSVYPTAEKIIINKLTNPNQQSLALAAIGVGLRMTDQMIKTYPQIATKKEEWVPFIHKVVNGLVVGILDAIDEPADSTLRQGL